MAVHDSTRELNEDNLKDSNSKPNSNEVEVLTDVLEHIHLIIDLSAADHVEDLEPHKEVENSGQMS